MEIAAVVLAVLLAVVMAASAFAKLTRQQQVVDNLDKAGVPHSMYPLLAGVQLVGALGLLVGIVMPWAGVAAGVGFFLYFLLAVGAHLRVGDKQVAVPLVLGLVGLAEAVLRAAA